jgi:AcrR family transcriptional regulator
MPTDRFQNLSERKKDQIRYAALEVFVHETFEKATISKIIEKAGISRGSFYTYFRDKRDVLEYIFEEAAGVLQYGWLNCAKKNGRDLWKTAETFMEFSIQNTNKDLLQLMIDIVDCKKMFGVTHQLCTNENPGLSRLQEVVYQSIDKSNFKDTSFETFNKLINIIIVFQAQCMDWSYEYPEDKEKVKKIFQEKLEILQYGICKE